MSRKYLKKSKSADDYNSNKLHSDILKNYRIVSEWHKVDERIQKTASNNTKTITDNKFLSLDNQSIIIKRQTEFKQSTSQSNLLYSADNTRRKNKKSKFSPPPSADHDNGQVVDDCVNKSNEEHNNNKTNNGDLVVISQPNNNMFRVGMKLKERLVVGISVVAVLFTLLLVVDIQMDLGLSGKHLVASHGRIKYVVQPEGPHSAYNSFRNRLLQKTHR